MEWPTTQECYDAMAKFSEYYMEGEQKLYWMNLIEEGTATDLFPPGKGFLHELDEVVKTSSKPSMPNRAELYELICCVCI